MKTVFTNAMCAHVWAQQTQPHGRSSSMKFSGTVIYSYQTAMAQIFKHENLALVNSRSYSKTTSCKHMPAITSALSIPFVRVPHVQPIGSGNHAENLGYLVAQYDAEKLRLMRARYVGSYEYLQILIGNARLYALAFKLKAPKVDAAKDEREIRKLRAEREPRLNTPANKAKRERAQARRAAAAAAAIAKREAMLAAGMSVAVAKFRNQERDSMFIYGLSHALLRVSRDGFMVETSQGAHVPVEDARRAIKFIAAVRAAGRSWEANGETLPVGQFQVNRIEATGNIRAGCHRIEWSEIAHLAGLLHVAIDVTPAEYEGCRT